MEITRDTKVGELMKEYTWMLDEAVKIDDRLAILKNPIAGAVFRRFSVADAAGQTGMSEQEIMDRIQALIAEHEGTAAQSPAPEAVPVQNKPQEEVIKKGKHFICK